MSRQATEVDHPLLAMHSAQGSPPSSDTCCGCVLHFFHTAFGASEQYPPERGSPYQAPGHQYQAPIVVQPTLTSRQYHEDIDAESGQLLPKTRETSASISMQGDAAGSSSSPQPDEAGQRANANQRHRRTRSNVSDKQTRKGRGSAGNAAEVLSSAAVNAAVTGVSNPTSQDEDEDFCPTCLEPYSADNPKIWTECGHHFHMPCIYEWLERKDTCPLCESKINI